MNYGGKSYFYLFVPILLCNLAKTWKKFLKPEKCPSDLCYHQSNYKWKKEKYKTQKRERKKNGNEKREIK